MISSQESKPGQGMTLCAVQFDHSPVPLVDQERVRLLLAIKAARDFYDLEFAQAEHGGYVRGLFMACPDFGIFPRCLSVRSSPYRSGIC